MGFTRSLALWCLWYLCLCALVLPQVVKARPAAVTPLYPPPPMILVQPTELPFAVVDVVQGCSLRPAVPVWELLREIAVGRWTRDLESPMMSGCDTPSAPHLEPSQRGDRIRSVSPS
jgi:hypothetical protein